MLKEHHETRKLLIEVTLSSNPDGLLIYCTLDVDSAISMYPVKSSVCTTTLKQASSEVHNLSIGYTTHTPSISSIIIWFIPH